MLQQLYVEERTRSDGDSGIKQMRMRRDGVKSYMVDSFAGHSISGLHDHSNLINTVGMGELIAVLNGLEFRTRHNDYKLRMPASNKTFNALENVPFPPVPPSVLRQPTMEKQAEELREYFKAWKNMDVHHRDYRKYFKPVLCYLEGAWTLDKTFAEPFSSDGKPIFSQWNYRIICHPLKAEVNVSTLVPLEDMQHRMGNGQDDWVQEVPGKDNYGANIEDDAFGMPKMTLDLSKRINVGHYHRRWKVAEKDAMGDTVGHRGFADRALFVAENTQARIAPAKAHVCTRQTGHKVCQALEKRVSYAIPLEVIFLTPLQTW